MVFLNCKTLASDLLDLSAGFGSSIGWASCEMLLGSRLLARFRIIVASWLRSKC
jgi:hypothetical protein